jgi:hypothetical protein
MTPLERKIFAIEKDIQILVKAESREDFWVMHYGAIEIDPGYLTYKICVKTDVEKMRLQANRQLRQRLRALLETHRYPRSARRKVIINVDAQESIDLESKGNAWHHWR